MISVKWDSLHYHQLRVSLEAIAEQNLSMKTFAITLENFALEEIVEE